MSSAQECALDRLVATDAGELLTLQRAAYITEAQLYGDPFLPALTQTLTELITELETAQGHALRIDGRLVGAVRASVHDDELHIGRLTVAPDVQGLGLGSRLLDVAEASTTGTSAVLFTGHLSAANIRLYERCGYRETHRTPLKTGVDLVHFRKHLR